MFTNQPTMDMDIEFDIKLLATEYYEGTVGISSQPNGLNNSFISVSLSLFFPRSSFVIHISREAHETFILELFQPSNKNDIAKTNIP